MVILKKGDKAPAFAATDQDGNPVSLKDYTGKKVILYFYPADDTPTCTTEACNLRDNYADLTGKGYEVLGVSSDSEKSHLKFIGKYNLPFRLVSDPDHKVATAFGVYDWKKFMGREFIGIHRTTFVIDGKGEIEKVIEKVVSKKHTEQIFETT